MYFIPSLLREENHHEANLPFWHGPSLVLEDEGRNYVVNGNGDIKIIELAADLGGVRTRGLVQSLDRRVVATRLVAIVH